MKKPLTTLLGAAILTGCATIDAENLQNVDMSPKTLYINYDYSQDSEVLVTRAESIKDYITKYFQQYRVEISFTETYKETDYNTITLSALKPQDYEKRLRLLGSEDVTNDSEEDIGTAFFTQRIAVVKETEPEEVYVFGVCPKELYIRTNEEDSTQQLVARVLSHEIGHLVGLYHPCGIKDTRITMFRDDAFNMMYQNDVGEGTFLDSIQEKIMHSYLSKGDVYEFLEKAKTKKKPIAWYMKRIK